MIKVFFLIILGSAGSSSSNGNSGCSGNVAGSSSSCNGSITSHPAAGALQNTNGVPTSMSSTGMGPVERRRRRKLPPIERPRSAPIHNMGFPGSGGPNSTNSDLDPAGNGAGKRTYNFLAKIFLALYLYIIQMFQKLIISKWLSIK